MAIPNPFKKKSTVRLSNRNFSFPHNDITQDAIDKVSAMEPKDEDDMREMTVLVLTLRAATPKDANEQDWHDAIDEFEDALTVKVEAFFDNGGARVYLQRACT